MRRELQSDLRWWACMMPAFLLAAYFVYGWVEHRTNPTTLLSAIGAISVGVLIACFICREREQRMASPLCFVNNVSAAEISIQEITMQLPAKDHDLGRVVDTENPWFTKGLNLARSKQYRDALYCFSYVLQSDPKNQAALTAKGECLMKMNRPEEALKAFMAAAQIDEASPLAREGMNAVLKRARASTWF
jgi:tetratricopeptide (TPR) repeat protein